MSPLCKIQCELKGLFLMDDAKVSNTLVHISDNATTSIAIIKDAFTEVPWKYLNLFLASIFEIRYCNDFLGISSLGP